MNSIFECNEAKDLLESKELNDIIINTITSNLDNLKVIFYWTLFFSFVAIWGIYNGNKKIKVLEFSIKTDIAYTFILLFYSVINFSILLLIYRNYYLVCNLDITNLNNVISPIKLHPWILNPFYNFDNPFVFRDFLSVLNFLCLSIVNGFGCLVLPLIWCSTVHVLFLIHGWNKSKYAWFLEIMYLVIFLIWSALIFFTMERLTYSPDSIMNHVAFFIIGLFFSIYVCIYMRGKSKEVNELNKSKELKKLEKNHLL